MTDDQYTHPDEDSPNWDNHDFCPFCRAALADAGAGFMEHIETADTCRQRFETWRSNVSGDMGGEWGG